MIKNQAKKYIFKSINISGIHNITRRLKRGVSALFYHGIEKEIINPVVQSTHLPLDLFERQIQYIRNNYDFISLDYLYECISNNYKLDPKHILITFDDGYKNNFNTVAPFLKAYDIPFTIFISTNHISNGSRFPHYYLQTAILYSEQNYINIPSINGQFDITTWEKRVSTINILLEKIKSVPQESVNTIIEDITMLLSADRWTELNNLFFSEEPMNWEDVKKLHYSGVTIGSHCHDHAVLHANQSNSEIEFQLTTSKNIIEKHLGKCRYFAYPNGRGKDISSPSLTFLKQNKYLLGFTTISGEIENNKENQFILPRIFPRKDMDSFKFVLNHSFLYNSKYNKWCSKRSS